MNLNFDFKKQFGQNFLTSDEIIDSFVEQINPTKDDFILEIGPGNGAITKQLVRKAGYILNIEIDKSLIEQLKLTFKDSSNWEVINKSILEVNFDEIYEIFENKKLSNIKICGSLPYNISKKIIAKFLEENYKRFNLPNIVMYFIIQKEVADEYLAKAPKSSFLSNYSSIYAEKQELMTIDKEFFYPIPKVDGKGLIFELKNNINYEYSYKLKKFIKHGFLNPRKILLNGLKTIGYTKDDFIKLNLPLNVRAAELELETWKKLYNLKN